MDATIEEPRFSQNGALPVADFGSRANRQPSSHIEGRTRCENGTEIVSGAVSP